jgi:hypothetical protein
VIWRCSAEALARTSGKSYSRTAYSGMEVRHSDGQPRFRERLLLYRRFFAIATLTTMSRTAEAALPCAASAALQINVKAGGDYTPSVHLVRIRDARVS